MVWLITALSWAGLALNAAHAGETRFARDMTLDLDELAASGKVTVSVVESGGVFRSDASAVLSVDPHRLFAVAADYDRYVEMGLPHLKSARVVQGSAADGGLVAWFEMSGLGQVSKHYLDVRLERALPDSALGMAWVLAAKAAAWPFVDEPAFSLFDGSFYILPLGDAYPGQVYVRYFAAGDPITSLPPALITGIVKKQFSSAAVRAIEIFGAQAAEAAK